MSATSWEHRDRSSTDSSSTDMVADGFVILGHNQWAFVSASDILSAMKWESSILLISLVRMLLQIVGTLLLPVTLFR